MKALYKIVHTSAGNAWQDPEKRILDEALWMREQGHQVVIIAPAISPLLARAKANGISTYAMSFRGLRLGSQYHQLKEILANEQPNILNAHGRRDGRISLKAAKKSGVPCRIISRHTGVKLRNSWQNRNLYKRLSHYVFAASGAIAEQTKQIFKLKDLSVFSIPDGIAAPATLLPPRETREKLAKALSLGPDERFIGLLEADNSRRAEVRQAINALTDLLTKHPHHHLVIPVSENDPQLEQSVEARPGRVHLTETEDLRSYCSALDCGVLLPDPVQGDRIPRAVLEAMHAGCPVVAGRTEGILEAVLHGETGLLFDPADSGEMTRAVHDTLSRKDAAMARAGMALEQAELRYGIGAMGRDVTRIYRLHQVKLERRYYKVDLTETY